MSELSWGAYDSLKAENARLQARVAEFGAEEEGAKKAFGVVAESNQLLKARVSRLESSLVLMRSELGRRIEGGDR